MIARVFGGCKHIEVVKYINFGNCETIKFDELYCEVGVFECLIEFMANLV